MEPQGVERCRDDSGHVLIGLGEIDPANNRQSYENTVRASEGMRDLLTGCNICKSGFSVSSENSEANSAEVRIAIGVVVLHNDIK